MASLIYDIRITMKEVMLVVYSFTRIPPEFSYDFGAQSGFWQFCHKKPDPLKPVVS